MGSVRRMCVLLKVSHSGYYSWKQKDQMEREKKKESNRQYVGEAFEAGRGSYGSRRIREHCLRRGVRLSPKDDQPSDEGSWNDSPQGQEMAAKCKTG